jgi:hypothetical protein
MYQIDGTDITAEDIGGLIGSTGATANAVLLADGAGGSTVKTSSKTITTSLGSDDTTVPTSKAVKAVTDGKIGGTLGATDNAVPRADGTGGVTAQTSLITIDDSGNMNFPRWAVLTKELGTDHTCSGLVAYLTAHESTTLFQVGYFDSSGEVALADADASANMPVRAMATGSIAADASGNYLLWGYARDDTWTWTKGGAIYASGTAGGLTQTAPTGTGKVVQIVGYAVSDKIMYFSPDLTFMELS